ncbi:MAG TPA: hypothetical protein VHZ30_01215, partial [Verrucomicrobiae bacterium]|nr:hypothetical protein [Verrucomicrobiae bacterium]
KRNKLNQPDFQKYDENWLLIHDIFQPTIDARNELRAQLGLNDLFRRLPALPVDFDAIFIHSRDLLFRWKDGLLEYERFDDPVALLIS